VRYVGCARIVRLVGYQISVIGKHGNKEKVMKVEHIKPFPPDTPWYQNDAIHMATQLGPDIIILHKNHPSQENPGYFIILNQKTGERMRWTAE
jgi:hypothetical protein